MPICCNLRRSSSDSEAGCGMVRPALTVHSGLPFLEMLPAFVLSLIVIGLVGNVYYYMFPIRIIVFTWSQICLGMGSHIAVVDDSNGWQIGQYLDGRTYGILVGIFVDEDYDGIGLSGRLRRSAKMFRSDPM